MGYIRKIEHSESKGLHVHCIFFLNGANVGDAIGWARQYGDAWQDSLPAGQDLYFSCNAKQRHYKYLGIGRIDYNNFEKRLNFQYHCLAYLVKNEQYLMSKKLKRDRTLARGEMPTERNGSHMGRPRKKLSEIDYRQHVVIFGNCDSQMRTTKPRTRGPLPEIAALSCGNMREFVFPQSSFHV